MSSDAPLPPDPARRRRPRYPGKNPRRFDQKYKEREPDAHPETIAKVLASGKTPAGTHRPIMVAEILQILAPEPGNFAIDCTLGYGGHTTAILERILPGGRLLAIDADPLEMARTEERLRAMGYDAPGLRCCRSNFAALPRLIQDEAREGADIILADLGVSSMQLDNPARGFSLREDGPLDMRMNPNRGRPASEFIASTRPEVLARIFESYSDEPFAELLGSALAGKNFATTRSLAQAIRLSLKGRNHDATEGAIRRVFQAIRIEINEELSALDSLLRALPDALAPSGRVAILSFHSGEDRRVKKAFEAGLHSGVYARISESPQQAGAEERHNNTRSSSAKLRWAIRSTQR